MNLKQLRNKKGWTQEYLAELTEYSVRTIQRYESGQKMRRVVINMFTNLLRNK